MSQENQQKKEKPTLIDQYKSQLESFKTQSQGVAIQFQQLQGAISACEHLIKLYEENKKQSDDSLVPQEDMGALNNGQVDNQTA